MNTKDMSIGTKLELELVNNLGEKIGRTYISQLLDIVDDENIIIAAPIYESRVIFVPTGANARIFFFHKRWGLMSFPALIVAKDKKDNILSFQIKVTGEFEKIQRRKYFRLDCNIPAYFRVCPDTETDDYLRLEIRKDIDKKTLESNYIKALTRNISGSGSCIVSDEKISKDATLELVLLLEGSSYIRTICKVMRIDEIDTSKDKKFETGLHFAEITDRGQDLVIKFIFEQQKQLLKRQVE
ncbi:MAG: flagellar brake domain-containing protein [Bacillota bacterium]|nr:flagellar brake domain-containing protein [Bacillota bacterium]